MSAVDVTRLLAKVGITLEERDKRGREWWICCPLPDHDDKTPSFAIVDWPGTEHHGLWRCYGCHQGGGPITLLRLMLGYGSREARAALADIDTPEAPVGHMTVQWQLRAPKRLVMPPEVVFAPLEKWSTPFRRYAERADRGITAWQVDRWGIGYAVDGDLAMRIVIPVRDERGELLSYTARSIVDETPKYWSPSLVQGRRPGAAFGRQHWPPPSGRQRVVVLEGAFDALACERAGVSAVATLDGSHLDPMIVDLLRTFREVVVATDLDAAGEGAVQALSACRELRFRRIRIPGGKDPAATSPEVLRAALAARAGA